MTITRYGQHFLQKDKLAEIILIAMTDVKGVGKGVERINVKLLLGMATSVGCLPLRSTTLCIQ